MNYAHTVRERLRKSETIECTEYARRSAAYRRADLAEAYHDLLHPDCLAWAERQYVSGGERFNCYFVHENSQAVRYIIIFEGARVKIVNILPLREPWQKAISRRKR